MQNIQVRKATVDIFEAALKAVDPFLLVQSYWKSIAAAYDRAHCRKLYVAGFGKAAYAMTAALAQSPMKDLITRGIVITKYGHTQGRLPGNIDVFEAGHPIPDEAGVLATGRLIEMLQNGDRQSLVLCLISGGASALLVAPCEGVSLADKQRMTELLLKAGADIRELNAVRKHLSRIKGGRLAAMARPSGIMSLILSDVIGDPLDVIASGPTAPDETTFEDATGVIKKYGLGDKIPRSISGIFQEGSGRKIAETPKADDPVFVNVENFVIGSNKTALEAAAKRASQMGFQPFIQTSELQGEARDVARKLALQALEVKRRKTEGEKICLISGGETTVTVRGDGIGGRNTELALAFAEEIEGKEGITFLSAGTDGTDGPTDAAGAVVDPDTIGKARAMGLSSAAFLKNNDSYTFFKSTGELLITGSTGTNVMDIQITLLT